MGDIKKIRKKYSRPNHPWRITRIEEENAISKEYGIPRKTEVWKAIAELESYKNQAKGLSALTSRQAEKEKANLLAKLQSYNLLKQGDTADAILGITLKDVLNRRLQTIVHKKNLAKTMKQSRQLITHRHILVNNKLVTSPAYLVRITEETTIEISPKSALYDVNHPERAREEDRQKRQAKAEHKEQQHQQHRQPTRRQSQQRRARPRQQ